MAPDRCNLVDMVVLLEGRSDVAAVRTVAAARGLAEDAHRYRLIDMGGVTTSTVTWLRPWPGRCPSGSSVCATPARRTSSPGARAGRPARTGRPRVLRLRRRSGGRAHPRLWPGPRPRRLDRVRLRARFATFCNQPAWRGRPLEHQLHRFAGTVSGRKALLAAALAQALEPEQVPAPLCRLVEQIAEGPLTERVRPPVWRAGPAGAPAAM